MLTGAGGSIGSELVRQLLRFEPAKLLLLDKDETLLYELETELAETGNTVPCKVLMGDIRQAVKTTNANVSQHLTILRHRGIIESRKDANFIYNRIVDQRVVVLMNTMQNLYCPEH